MDICQDKLGFIWCATEDGLCRFDGNGFKAFRHTAETLNETGILANELNCVADDPEENWLWIGTQRCGVSRLTYNKEVHLLGNKCFKSYIHDDKDKGSITENSVTDICVKNGNVWICSYWGGIELYDRQNDSFIHYNKETVKGFVSNQVWTCEDAGDILYIGHVWDGMSMINIKKRTAQNFKCPTNERGIPVPGENDIISNEVNTVCKDKYGNVWIGTSAGLCKFIPKEKRFVSYKELCPELSTKIYKIIESSDDELWVTTAKSRAVVLNLKSKTFLRYEDMGELPYTNSNFSVKSLFEDRFGNHWAGMIEGGLCFIPRKGVTLFNIMAYSPYTESPYTLLSKAADGIAFNRSGNMFVGSHGGGVTEFIQEEGLWKRIRALNNKSELKYLDIQDVFCDHTGQIWICANGGNLCYIDSKEQIAHSVFEDAEIRCITEDDKGSIWIGTSYGAVEIGAQSHTFVSFVNLPIKYVWSLSVKDDKIYAGTFGGGLVIYNQKTKESNILNIETGYPSNTINDIYIQGKNTIWIATGAGLLKTDSDGKIIQEFAKQEPIKSVIEDQKGNIWYASSREICCINTNGDIIHFGGSKGIPKDVFCEGSVAFDKEGKLYFGSTNGLTYFSPDKVLNTSFNPHAVITDMNLLAQDDDNSFSISFSTDDYSLHDEVEYAYRLEGFDDKWYVTTDTKISYHNMPPGDYKFQVKARTNVQNWNEDYAEYCIHVTPPLWLTWWMKCIYFLILVAIVSLILWFWQEKVRFKEQTEAVKQELDNQLKANQEQLDFYKNISKGLEELKTQHNTAVKESDNEFINKVTNLIMQNLDSSQMDVNYLASEMGMSNSTLYRKMKSVLGISALDYIKDVKMKHARELLISDKYSISEIGYMLGYSTPQAFRKDFKDKYGKSPSEFMSGIRE